MNPTNKRKAPFKIIVPKFDYSYAEKHEEILKETLLKDDIQSKKSETFSHKASVHTQQKRPPSAML